MQKKWFLLVFFLGFSSHPMLAQDYSKYEVFGGYQYTRIPSDLNLVESSNANGWDGSFTYHGTKSLGLTVDFNGAYQTPSGVAMHYHSFAAGPVFYLPSKGKVKPYVHALFGGMLEAGSGPYPFVVPAPACTPSNPNCTPVHFSVSGDVFTSLLGGGVDVKLNRYVSLRLVQADWVYDRGSISQTSTNSAGVVEGTYKSSGNVTGTFKIATGLVVYFGGRKK